MARGGHSAEVVVLSLLALTLLTGPLREWLVGSAGRYYPHVVSPLHAALGGALAQWTRAWLPPASRAKSSAGVPSSSALPQQWLGEAQFSREEAAQQLQELIDFAKGRAHRGKRHMSKRRDERHLFHSHVNDIFEWRIFWPIAARRCERLHTDDASAHDFLADAVKRIVRAADYLEFKPKVTVDVPKNPEVRTDHYVQLHREESGLKVRGASVGSEDQADYAELKVRMRTKRFYNPLTGDIEVEDWDKTLREQFGEAKGDKKKRGDGDDAGGDSDGSGTDVQRLKSILVRHAATVSENGAGMLGDLNVDESLSAKVLRAADALHEDEALLVRLHKRRLRGEMWLGARRRKGLYKIEVTDVKAYAPGARRDDDDDDDDGHHHDNARSVCYRSFAVEGPGASAVATFAMVVHDMVPHTAGEKDAIVGGYPAFIKSIAPRRNQTRASGIGEDEGSASNGGAPYAAPPPYAPPPVASEAARGAVDGSATQTK